MARKKEPMSPGRYGMKVLRLVLDVHVNLHACPMEPVPADAREELEYRLGRLRDLCQEKINELHEEAENA